MEKSMEEEIWVGGMKRLLVKFEAYQYQYNVDSKYPRNYEN
jgi:hypothetical protein